MTKKLFSFLLIWIFFPIASFWFNADFGDNLNINTPINWDYYIAGWIVNINTNVDWDIYAAWWKVFINGNIKQDVMLIGSEEFISWYIWESARLVWAKIEVESTIEKDLLIAGWMIKIKEKSIIKWETKIIAWVVNFEWTANNVSIKANEVNFKWVIKWDATINAQKIKIQTGAKILGNLNYESPNKITNLEEIVSWEITFKQIKQENGFVIMLSDLIWARFAFLLIFGLILLFVGKKRISPSIETLNKESLKSLWYGALICIGLPIVAILLAITIIGLPFAFVAIMSFITIMIFAKLLNVYFYTNFLIERFGGYDKLNKFKQIWILLICVILSTIMNGVDAIFTFFALGAIIKTHIIKKK